MDTYEKKYKEALERARDYKNNIIHKELTVGESIMDYVFPELKESKDERIRKEIINYFAKGKEYLSLCSFSKEEILAWLEKQGKQKDIHLMELKAKAYDDAKERMSYAYNQNRVYIGFISEIFPNLSLYEKQAEQKPVEWSEEDDDDAWMNDIISKVENNLQLNKAEIDWLKSLKNRYTWKPSDEQMEALKGVQEGIFRLGILESLYNDLMKLKE